MPFAGAMKIILKNYLVLYGQKMNWSNGEKNDKFNKQYLLRIYGEITIHGKILWLIFHSLIHKTFKIYISIFREKVRPMMLTIKNNKEDK